MIGGASVPKIPPVIEFRAFGMYAATRLETSLGPFERSALRSHSPAERLLRTPTLQSSMNTNSSRFDALLASLALLCGAGALLAAMHFAQAGFDLTDEGYYLAS
ncbi:MAG: hypothetical protein JWP08_346, partial [Bryobacterales bacterium]|nr:hypothetical protein [Bryobacterales bacterium]